MTNNTQTNKKLTIKNSDAKKINVGEEKTITKRLATEKHPTIEAIINGLFRFDSEEKALERIDTIKDHFIVSSKLPKEHGENEIKLWIRGFDVTEDEIKKGFLGNYASFKPKKIENNKYTIIAVKQRIALKYHPQRKRKKNKHPDWGHPCLRIVKKQITFENIEDAQKVLTQLHEEYPEISIPAVNKLFLIIYSKVNNPPVQKYILEIIADREGGFVIDFKENNYKKQELPESVAKEQEAVEQKKADNAKGQQAGYFTSMVSLKRNKQDQIKKLRDKKKEEENS